MTFSNHAIKARADALDGIAIALRKLPGDHEALVQQCEEAKMFLGLGHVRQAQMTFRDAESAFSAENYVDEALSRKIAVARTAE